MGSYWASLSYYAPASRLVRRHAEILRRGAGRRFLSRQCGDVPPKQHRGGKCGL